MSEIILELSYPIKEKAPGIVLGLPEMKINWRAKYGDGQGKSNQTASIEVFNHHGTHIDAPSHVIEGAKNISDYDLSYFVFTQPLFIKLPKEEKEKITKSDLENYDQQLAKSDIILVYTGFSKYRGEDNKKYVFESPAFSIGAAEYIVNNFPNIRCVGMDIMGVENIPEGRKTNWTVHRELLKNDCLILEDAKLSNVLGKKLDRVIALPLKTATEASVTTVIGETDNN